MRLRAPEVERRLRNGALRIINSSPRLKREYRKHRTPTLTALLQRMPALSLVIVFLSMPGCLGAAAGNGVAESEVSFGLASVIAGLVSTLLAMSLVSQLRGSRDLVVLSTVPIEDHAIARHRQHRAVRSGAILLPPMLVFYGAVVLAWQMPAGTAAVVLWLGLLELAVILGFGFVLAALLLGRIDRIGCLVLLVAAVCGIVVVSAHFLDLRLPVPWQSLASAANILLPTGWPHAMLQYGVIQQERSAWLMLAPVAILLGCIPAAVARLGRVYRVREIMLSGDGTGAAVLPPEWYGLKVDAESEEVWISPIAPESTAEASFGLNRDALRRYVRASNLLAGWDWQRIGRRFSVERLVRPLLTERERDIVQLMLPAPPNWTGRAIPLTFLAAGSGLVPYFFFGPPAAPPTEIVCIVPLAFIAITAISAQAREGWVSASGEVASPVALVPVAHREVARVAMVVGMLRGLAILPAAVVAGTSAFLGAGLSTGQGALTGLRCVVVFVALHHWGYWTFTKQRTSVQTGLAPLLRQSVYGTLLVAFIIAAFLSVQPRLGEPWNTLLAGVMFACGWMASRFDERRFNRGGYDLTARPVAD